MWASKVILDLLGASRVILRGAHPWFGSFWWSGISEFPVGVSLFAGGPHLCCPVWELHKSPSSLIRQVLMIWEPPLRSFSGHPGAPGSNFEVLCVQPLAPYLLTDPLDQVAFCSKKHRKSCMCCRIVFQRINRLDVISVPFVIMLSCCWPWRCNATWSQISWYNSLCRTSLPKEQARNPQRLKVSQISCILIGCKSARGPSFQNQLSEDTPVVSACVWNPAATYRVL